MKMLSLIILFCSGLSENHEMNSQQEIAICPNHKKLIVPAKRQESPICKKKS